MCGVAGYLGNIEIAVENLQDCVELMRRRGPDHAAWYRHDFTPDRHAYLLHSRLSIIDLDARASQPFRVGSMVMSYNGEIYNYLELKHELGNQGRTFQTTSDTETLLKVIDHFGCLAGLDKCEGMWAFALYRESDGSLLLGRDRFGEKPLYLYRDTNGLFFGSEIKFIASLLGRRLDVNENHLYRYLVNGYKALYKVRETFFQGVEELPPAHVLRIDRDGKETLASYWQPHFGADQSMNYAEAVEGVRERLIRSVELRLRADVPMAFCMSGGVDSNSLISIAKRVFNHDVHGFTILNDDERYEESDLVAHVVQELGIRHTGVSITSQQLLGNLTELVRYHDAPVYTISYYVHWQLMSRIAAEGYRISISGTAADELLTGYYDHHNLYLFEVRATPLFNAALDGWQTHIAPLVRNPYLQNPRLYMDNSQFRGHIFLNNIDFANYLCQDWYEAFTEEQYTDSLLRNRMLNELYQEAVPVILHEDDLNAMYYSIENRSPYLDRDLFEFCCRIPSRHLVRNGFAKVVLRDAMEGIVPERILWNPRKVGFNAPINSLLDTKNKQTKQWLLDNSPIFEHVRKPMIEGLLEKNYLPNSESKFLFYFLNAKVFLEEFSQTR
jgi:asparagine synthase (glutamine-hydrolysing)